MPHPDLAAEQAYIDDAYACLAAMRERTRRAADIADSAAEAVDSLIAQAHLRHRQASLDADVPGLSFGRLDEEGDATWYIGRRHVEDARGDPVVVDWRAEVATPFYRATPVDPLGLRRRRRFLMTGPRVDDLFDEVFDDPDSVDAAHHGGIPDPLLAELERERTGEMRDIVATIAAEQDEVIRAPLDTCLVVQGGPGTGKTAVGLHRAAFLLYEHRARLDAEGVLVVGPNPIFLRYIAQVLPSLGEVAARQTTLNRLLAGTSYRVTGVDDDEAARIKGDGRMAEVIARAVASAVRTPDEDLSAMTTWGRARVGRGDVVAAAAEVRARGVAHNVGRAAFRAQLARLVRADLLRRRSEEVVTTESVGADLRRDREWGRTVDRLWPALSAPALVRRLLTNRAALAAAAEGLLSADEQAAIRRRPVRRAADEPWTAADLALVDEAEAAVTGPPPTYGHIVVDEAQDLSTMGLRALARRSRAASMTVLGDLAQATAPAAQMSWEAAIAALGSPASARRADLDLGYRVPDAIMDVANGLLVEAAPDVVPTRSVRAGGRPPAMVATSSAALAEAVSEAVAQLGASWSSIAVVVPPPVRAAVEDVLSATSLPVRGDAGEGGITTLDPADVKGLEFDAVVVVEPASIAGDTARGLRMLYVALTRAVQELVIVHAGPLPPGLAA
ncbi:MAG TPA: ATP-binding domain-containing protein [Acidimicrobiales bacterium]|nr:ATP-binding domain-containing protein [Acidimicrobiales bacterium]